jgi:glyoxylase-like metal-dependent hydrolase (beta-lactamase superfamily II)
MMDRRELLKGAMAGTIVLWAAPFSRAAQRLTETLVVLDSGGTNVVAFSGAEGLVLVDTGVRGAAPAGKAQTVFNTHYHPDHTGNNETFTAAGAKIIAHDRTRQFMANDLWIPDQDSYRKARPKAAWPTEVFFDKGSMKAGAEQIDYGHLLLAHTSGDIYVHFKDSNVLVVGDVASPVNDP